MYLSNLNEHIKRKVATLNICDTLQESVLYRRIKEVQEEVLRTAKYCKKPEASSWKVNNKEFLAVDI